MSIEWRVTDPLEQLEWGSCDGCHNHHRCTVCGAERIASYDPVTFEDYDEPRPGQHKPECPVPAWIAKLREVAR